MRELNEIVKRWKGIDNFSEEQDLFDAYCEARQKYKAGLSKRTKGDIYREELEDLYEAERNAFSSYLRHRTLIKPTGDET